MKFRIIQSTDQLPTTEKNIVILKQDAWDDWFKYNTMYKVFYYDSEGKETRLGDVKIGEFNMVGGQRRANTPNEFERLSKAFFFGRSGR